MTNRAHLQLAYGRALVICLGVCCLLGVSTAVYVYLRFPHPAAIYFPGAKPRSESIEVYLFGFPAMLTFLFVGIGIQIVFWKRFIPWHVAFEARQIAKQPALRNLDPTLLYGVSSVGMAIGGLLLLALTIYRAVLVATGNI